METNFEFCLIGKCSDTGRVRKANEDSMDVFDTDNMKVFVVCDGMGGHVGGQIASQTAIAAIKNFMLSHIFTDPYEAIHNAIIAANDAIIKRAQTQPELNGMGSTCVMLVVTRDGKVYYGHTGDSRIYIVANHQITQLTKDHSFVQTLVDQGKISKEQAEHHPRKNEITNALGIPDMQPPTLCGEPIEPEAGNCFVLCSDGLSGMIDDQHIERVVSKHQINIQQRARKLVEMANEAGGKDNITVQLVEFVVSTQNKKINNKASNKNLYRAASLAIIVILAAVFAALIIAAFIFLGKNKAEKDDSNENEKVPMEQIVQVETIPILYAKGSSAFIDTKIPDNESIVDYKITKGEQFIEIVQSEKGRYLLVRWMDKDFSEADLKNAEIEFLLITDKKNEYIRHIVLVVIRAPSEQTPIKDNNLSGETPLGE
ncbi:MAG: Stp1/IreP family PP2C-type Ser/Thr phosphatase [Spirochaetaceae bacterium]|jgi:serine/threonine protein phosphatase PrpC|nr:Stp1/IreP family PP2C-type Ser/Thr phosphatase [Spirochaetaceae bacterium]